MTGPSTAPLDLRAPQTIPWRDAAPQGVALGRVYIGADPLGGGMQIAVSTVRNKPTRAMLKELWDLRGGRRGVNVAVVALHGDLVTVFGPDPQVQPIEDLPTGQAQRMLQVVLDEPNAIAAWDRFATTQRERSTTGIGGCTNSGFFARHHLRKNVPLRPDWQHASERAARLLRLRGRALIAGLGFTVQERGGVLLLSGEGSPPRAVAVLLDPHETFDGRGAKHQLSPVAFGLREAGRHDVDWLVALKDDRIRLYSAKTGVGVGQKGQTETYFEIDLAAIDNEHVALLSLVFSAQALDPQGTTRQILDGSAKYATDLGTRLRDRIYKDVVPPLSRAVAGHLLAMGLRADEQGLRTAYRVTLRILFRLLFQAYAEDRGLLPAGRNERYDANSLKTAARRDMDTDPSTFGTAATLWADLEQVWEAIDQGNAQWMVPAYNGGLFARTKERSEEGAMIARLRLPDSAIGPVLQALLVDVNEDGVPGAVDFQSLSVREFGTIYEGLLESSLSLAESDLTLDASGAWVQAADGDSVVVPAGVAYFHNSSGERKATGSYFTPKIVVDHLIERSIVPVLGKHLERIAGLLDDGKEVEAGREFFDFRVADLAMGSGHFLVAAIDRVEAMYRDFLTEHDVPRVREELLRIGQAAKEALGPDRVAAGQVDDISLLRRQVARRCIYGIDLNPLALELSRLALWIHTFVPGLPMSSFDHNLVCANSLTGIGTVEEALAALEPKRPAGQVSLVDGVVTDALAAAAPLLLDAANADEADKAGVEAGAALRAEAREKLEPLRRVFDLAIAIRTGGVEAVMAVDLNELDSAASNPAVREAAEQSNPAHMPYLFPEVFQRTDPGFDVLLGNPPWEKAKIEVSRWWAARFPGLRGIDQGTQDLKITDYRRDYPLETAQFERELIAHRQMRRALTAGPYPGIGKGDPDLYLAFAWRYLQATRASGIVSMVAPRSLVAEAAGEAWRTTVYDEAQFSDVLLIENRNRWAFDMEPRYSIALISVTKLRGASTIALSGPFASPAEFAEGARQPPVRFNASEFRLWGSGGAFPQLRSREDGRVYAVARVQPRLDQDFPDSWRSRPFAELHSASDKPHFALRSPRAEELPVFKGRSFRLWEPDTGVYYGAADSAYLNKMLLQRRFRQARNSSSPFSEFSREQIADPATLPIRSPRIAIRKIARATDTRTIVCALVPPNVALTDGAPFLLWPRGSSLDQAFLLGVLSSRVLDWIARRTVEVNVTYHVLNSLPIPRPPAGDSRWERAVEIAGRLAAVDERYQEWADEVGVPVGSVKTRAEKQDLIDELDALVSLLYGLTADQVVHIYATFHRGWDYAPRLAAVLEHFHAWEGKA